MKEKEGMTAMHNANSSGVAGVIMGIISLMLLSVVSIPAGVTGLVFSIVQYKRAKNRWAVAGIILSILGIIMGVVVAYLTFNIIGQYAQQLQQLQNLQNVQP